MSHIGRVARLCRSVESPELNGLYVVVIGGDGNVHEVQVLVPPTEPIDARMLCAADEQLDFVQPDTFASRYPHAEVLQGGSSKITTDGSILDVSDGFRFGVLAISNSALVRGRPSPFTSVAMMCPHSIVTSRIVVANPKSTKIIEFEDIHFDFSNSPATGLLTIASGGATFRRCRFTGTVPVQPQHGSIKVVFESCLFEGGMTNPAMAVLSKSHVTCWNCFFRNSQIAVCMGDDCSVDMTHCSLENMGDSGVTTVADKAHLQMTNCSINNCAESGLLFAGSHDSLVIRGCRVELCKNAILLGGTKLITLQALNCLITDCDTGLSVKEGKVDATMSDCTVSQCQHSCVFVCFTAIGHVTCTNCNLQAMRPEPTALCCNMSGYLCEVVVNGVLQRDEKGYASTVKKCVAGWDMDKIEQLPLQERRMMKKVIAEAGLVRCANCHEVEPMEEKFKTCGKCKNVCYCSRLCQLAHWQQHKKECR